MHKLHQWRKEGYWSVYEGKHGIAIGDDVDGYDCFGSKTGNGSAKQRVRFDDKGVLYNPNANVLMGRIKDKRSAARMIDRVDRVLKSDKVWYLPVTNKLVPTQTMTATNRRKGAIVIYSKNNISDKLHEIGHIKAGMATSTSARSYHYNDEIAAIRYQIQELNKRGLWNSKNRNLAIKNLSGYSKIPFQKKRRAARDIKRIEAKLGLM